MKYSSVKSLELNDSELALINRQSLRELSTDEVYIFKVRACDNQIDRDFECFSDAALGQLAKLYVGKTMIMDHRWSAANQTARVYAGEVEDIPNVSGGKCLILRVYMLKNDSTKSLIDMIEGGIWLKCSPRGWGVIQRRD